MSGSGDEALYKGTRSPQCLRGGLVDVCTTDDVSTANDEVWMVVLMLLQRVCLCLSRLWLAAGQLLG